MPDIVYKDLSRISYAEALKAQKETFDTLINSKKTGITSNISGVLYLCEHNPVYTLGRNADERNFRSTLHSIDAEIHKIGRGGDVTYHGPGQLVGYPVIDLESWGIGLAEYVHSLENTIMATLKEYDIHTTTTKKAPGVWIDPDGINARKIAAIGIQSSRWVTMHGFALNINTDLTYFNHIVPCGIPDKAVTSLKKELGKEIPMDEVKMVYQKKFAEIFNSSLAKAK